MDLGDPEDRVFAAERIIKKRMKGRKTEFLVKWKGWSQRHNTWEPEENILDQRLIDSFERQQRKSGKKFELVQKKKKALSTLLKRPSKDTKKQESESEDEKPSSSSQIKIKQELDKDDSSDSSDDEVLCKKEVPVVPQPEAKRKAEVLSKESGKIGITIKTSPPSATPTSVVSTKEEKLKKEPVVPMDTSLAPEKKSEEHTDAKKLKLVTPLSDNNKTSNQVTEKSSNKTSTTPIVTPTTPVVPPLAIKTTKEDSKTSTIPTQSTTKEEKETKAPPKPLFFPQNHQPQTQTKQDSHTATAPQPVPEPQTPAKQQATVPPPVVVPAEPTSPYHEFAAPRLWLPKFQLTDQIFITDVTVNSETATIRECKTEKGFFKERTAINTNQESIPVTQP